MQVIGIAVNFQFADNLRILLVTQVKQLERINEPEGNQVGTVDMRISRLRKNYKALLTSPSACKPSGAKATSLWTMPGHTTLSGCQP